MSKIYDTIIIGAGVAGLSTSALLSKRGYSVLVLEKDKTIGGRAKVIEKEGFRLDYGLHLNRFGNQGALAKVLRELNKEVEFQHLGQPLVYVNIEDKFYPFPNTISSFFKIFFTTKFLSVKSKLKFLQLFTIIPFSLPKKYHTYSVADFIKRHNPTQQMIDIINLFCGVAFICPDWNKVAAIEAGEFLRKVLFARRRIVGYIKGGFKTLFEILINEINQSGEILTNNRVKEVVIRNNEVKSIITDENKEYVAKSYVIAIPFQQLHQILDLNKLTAPLKEYAEKVEPTSGISLDFALNRKISDISGMIMTARPVLSLGIFISNVEEEIAPKGKQLGLWFCSIPSDKIKDKKYVKEQIELLKELLNRMFPNIWNYLLFERVLILDIVDGAVPKVGQTYLDRPYFKSNIDNLFFAGDTTAGRGWGGDVAFDSAIECSKLVTQFLQNKK